MSGVNVNPDTMVTAAEAASLLCVDRHLIYVWRGMGKLSPMGTRGRSPLYRWADVVMVERQTRQSPYSHRVA